MIFEIRVSEKLVSKALYETDPVKAVGELSGFWGPRINSSLPNLGLSKTEYQIEICLIYHGEVFNGGHFQYFTNRGTVFSGDTIDALSTVGLNEYSNLLSQASQKLPVGVDYMEPHQLDDQMVERWEEADRIFRQLEMKDSPSPDVDGQLLNHLKNNKHDFLISERGI